MVITTPPTRNVAVPCPSHPSIWNWAPTGWCTAHGMHLQPIIVRLADRVIVYDRFDRETRENHRSITEPDKHSTNRPAYTVRWNNGAPPPAHTHSFSSSSTWAIGFVILLALYWVIAHRWLQSNLKSRVATAGSDAIHNEQKCNKRETPNSIYLERWCTQ